jgi:hypothetical protein
MKAITDFIPAALYALLIGSLVWAGVSGLRGRTLSIPSRSGIDMSPGVTVRGRGARIIGLVLLLLAALFVYAAVRGVAHG